ncbi:MAG: LCP family protein [Solobacterium sp.]|nr:LCP family protein [Solobacterium sp.]
MNRRYIKPTFFWGISLIAAVVFLFIFGKLPMFPKKWTLFAFLALVAVHGVTAFFSLTTSPKKIGIKVVNIVLAAALVFFSVILPVFTERVSDVITANTVTTDNTIKMNLYVMNEDYLNEHPEVKANYPEIRESLSDFKNHSFITTLSIDNRYQTEALTMLRGTMEKEDIGLIDKKTLAEAGEALYSGEGQVLMMTDIYASMLLDMEEFEDFDQVTRVLYTIRLPEVVNQIKISDATLTEEPFTVFIGGNDQEGDLMLTGRTDVDMLVTVNPKTHQVVINSLPRDSYVPNPAGGYAPDKLTHLGMSGLSNTLTELSNLFHVKVENYILINFTTFMKIIDGLGGIDIDNPYAFTYTWDENYVYDEGRIHLDGQAALYYVRERYNLIDGDFGRNMHQQIVMKGILEKAISPAVITRFNSMLEALKGTFLTNLSEDSIYGLCQKQLDEGIQWNIVNYRALGLVDMAVCASAPGQELSIVLPYRSHIQYMAQVIDDVISGKTVVQEDMGDGYGILVDPIHIPTTPEPTETAEPT